MYTNISSCVMNNGFTTKQLKIRKGVRQGDPLSPYLFILALEILAIKIRSDSKIEGFKIGGETIKLSIFADDMTNFLKNKSSYDNLFLTLEAFEKCSGLKVNHEKTEILGMGTFKPREGDFRRHETRQVIKILGVYFGYNEKDRNNSNFKHTLKCIKRSINMWKWRNLTLLGKIQIVKTFAIPKFMYRASVIPTSKDLIKEVNAIFYNFIWNGKDKVKRRALINNIEQGGLKMIDVECTINTKRVLCLKKYLEESSRSWKTILNKYLAPVGGKFIFHCNYDFSKLQINLPDYYKECLVAWSALKNTNKCPTSCNEISNEILWNNKMYLC